MGRRHIISCSIGISVIWTLGSCSRINPALQECDPFIQEVADQKVEKYEDRVWEHSHIKADSIYYKYFDYAFMDSLSLLILVNEIRKTLEIFDLQSEKRVFCKRFSQYNLPYPPNGFLNGVDFIHYDSIFLASDQWIWLLDTMGVKQQLPVPEAVYKGNRIKLYNLDHSPMRYDRGSGALLFESYSPSVAASSRRYYSMPVTTSVYIKDGSTAVMPVTYPPVYRSAYFGLASMVFRSVENGRSFYSFPADPHVYIWDHQQNEIDSFCGRSSRDHDPATPIQKRYKRDTEYKLRAMVRMPFYLSVVYDPWRKRYYRFFLTALPEKKATGQYNTWSDKELMLMVFDPTYQFVNEYSLGVNQYSFYRSFVGKEGLYLAKYADPLDTSAGSHIEFDILK